jgi:hypothetical protein
MKHELHSRGIRLSSILAAGLLSACAMDYSHNVKQERVYTSYHGRYVEGGPVEWRATFNFGGSTGTYLELTTPSRVTVDGEDLERDINAIHQVFYTLSKDVASFPQSSLSATFLYVDNDEKEYRNTFSIPPAVTLNAPASVRAVDGPIQLAWTTTSLADDSLSLTLRRRASSQSESSEGLYSDFDCRTNRASGSCTVTRTVLEEARGGELEAQICRSRTVSAGLQRPEVGGSAWTSYCSSVRRIEVD